MTDFDKLDQQYRDEGWGRIMDEALPGVRPSNVESQARAVATWCVGRIAALEAQLAEAKAALHIATNDKLSLLDHLDTERQRRMAQIDYSCDLQRIIEDLCRGGPVREPKTSARHHYDMATAFLSALEVTPPAPKVTEADMEWLFEFRENWVNDGSRPNYQQMAKAYAAKMHPWEAAASIYEGRFEDALTAAQDEED